MQHSFSAQNSLAYRGIQRGEVHILLHNILQEPDIFEKHIERFALYCWLIPWLICSLTIRAVSGSILMTAYGYQIESNEDEFVHLAKIVTDRVVALGSAGTTLVDFIPLCKIRACHQMIFLIHLYYSEVRTRMGTRSFLPTNWEGLGRKGKLCQDTSFWCGEECHCQFLET